MQEQEEIIRITIDLGNSLPAESIIVMRGEENQSEELARRFCLKHGFDQKIQAALSLQIQRNIDQVMNQITDEGSEQEQLVTNQDGYDEGIGSTNRPQAVECLNDESEYELNQIRDNQIKLQ